MASTQNMDPTTNSNVHKEAETKNEYPKDNHSVTKRLQNDLKTLLFSAAPGISAFPINDNLFKWRATVVGGESTVYDGLEYKLTIDFPSGYPYSAPSVKFESACYHPNVDKFGNICLDILKEKWTASYDVRTILLSIQSLLAEPNNDSPLNSQAAELWDDKMAYKKYLLDHYETNVKSASASKS